ncbi:MAG: DUF2061 domain-containing protein [Bacteroidetes bacterium]|nr:MAG: DUF2061 domain-containing protein [Bacteroidota bacterium]
MILNQVVNNDRDFVTDKVSERPVRSIVKSISWRILGTMDTIIISWLITGTLRLAFSIGAVELISKMILYFFHERIWNTIKWGKL